MPPRVRVGDCTEKLLQQNPHEIAVGLGTPTSATRCIDKIEVARIRGKVATVTRARHTTTHYVLQQCLLYEVPLVVRRDMVIIDGPCSQPW